MRQKIVFLTSVIILVALCVKTAFAAMPMMRGCMNTNKDGCPMFFATNEVKTTQYFTDDKVLDYEVKLILDAGRNAESGMNYQPWFFVAVASDSVLNEFKTKMKAQMGDRYVNSENPKAQFGDAPLNIIVFCKEGSDFDAALATENMLIAATNLGYGTKIVASGMNIAGEYAKVWNVPEGYVPVCALLIGNEKKLEDVDAVSSATTRAPFEEKVWYVK